MHIELVDILRCPNRHEDTWLVATVDEMADRHIVRGSLGCPICRAEYTVQGGVVYFAPAEAVPVTLSSGDQETALTLAAALELTGSRMVALLQGEWTAHAHLIRSLSPARLLLLNAARDLGDDDDISKIVGTTVPLGASSITAVAFDRSASTAMIEAMVRALRPGGRLVGPASSPLPHGVSEITRNESLWVGQRDADAPVMVPLGRARSK